MNSGAYNFDTPSIKDLPLSCSKEVDSDLKQLVLKIIEQKNIDNNSKVTRFQDYIDLFVYKIYRLRYKEILMIDPDTKITREEYDNLS